MILAVAGKLGSSKLPTQVARALRLVYFTGREVLCLCAEFFFPMTTGPHCFVFSGNAGESTVTG